MRNLKSSQQKLCAWIHIILFYPNNCFIHIYNFCRSWKSNLAYSKRNQKLHLTSRNKWDKVFKNEPYHFKSFKGCLRQILFGLLLNTLSQILKNLTVITQDISIQKDHVLTLLSLFQFLCKFFEKLRRHIFQTNISKTAA